MEAGDAGQGLDLRCLSSGGGGCFPACCKSVGWCVTTYATTLGAGNEERGGIETTSFRHCDVEPIIGQPTSCAAAGRHTRGPV